MSKANTFENSLLQLIFNAVPIAGLADNAATSPNTHLFVRFHTADPGETGTQATNETTYGGYAAVSVVRTSVGWTVTNNVVNPAAPITAPAIITGSGSLTHFTIGMAATGASTILYRGAITPPIPILPGGVPTLSVATTITEE